MIADLGLGGNVGDRLAVLQDAVDGLRSSGCEVIAVSGVYETDPVGGPDQPDFLNAVVRVRTSRDPHGLLGLAMELEQRARRVRVERWGPRTLDVDVLRCSAPDDEGRWISVDDPPDLVVPHPRLHLRGFVLVPLSDVDLAVDPSDVDTTGVRPTSHSLH